VQFVRVGILILVLLACWITVRAQPAALLHDLAGYVAGSSGPAAPFRIG
jgi:hypothetical protein